MNGGEEELHAVKKRLEEAYSIAVEGRDLAQKNNEELSTLKQSLHEIQEPMHKVAEFLEDAAVLGRIGRRIHNLYTSKSVRGFMFLAATIWLSLEHDASKIAEWARHVVGKVWQ